MSEPSWDEARTIAVAAAKASEPVSTRFAEALGATCAVDVLALAPLPHAPTSAMDGWAVAGDGPWHLVEPTAQLADGNAQVIVTGGVPPAGCTAVLQREHGEVAGTQLLGPTPEANRHIRPAGQEARPGDVLVAAGSELRPTDLALIANTGHDSVVVRTRPRVHLVVTGDELQTAGIPVPGRVRDVMTPMLPPLLVALGAQVSSVVHVSDDADLVAAEAGNDFDLLISAGGTGQSAADPIARAWQKLDAEIKFRGVDMRPGHPVSLAVLPDGRPWLALPGNPLAAVLTALSFVPALVAGHCGRELLPLAEFGAGEEFKARAGATLIPVNLGPNGLVPAGPHRSNQLRGLASAQFVAVIPAAGAGPADSIRVLPRTW